MNTQRKSRKAAGSVRQSVKNPARKAVFRRLVSILENSGISDNAFAAQHGLPGSVPGKWREGAKKGVGPMPSGEMLLRLRETLGVSPTWVLTGEGARLVNDITEKGKIELELKQLLTQHVLSASTEVLPFQFDTSAAKELHRPQLILQIDPNRALQFLKDAAVEEARTLAEWFHRSKGTMLLVGIRESWMKLGEERKTLQGVVYRFLDMFDKDIDSAVAALTGAPTTDFVKALKLHPTPPVELANQSES